MRGFMKVDIRADAAKYYDLNPSFPNDIPVYPKSFSAGGHLYFECLPAIFCSAGNA
jgi:hypothetical protein